MRVLVKERAHARLEAFQKSKAATEKKIKQLLTSSKELPLEAAASQEMTASSDINLLVEIVSATDLPIADFKSTDPYVKVYMGKQEVHKTKPIPKTYVLVAFLHLIIYKVNSQCTQARSHLDS